MAPTQQDFEKEAADIYKHLTPFVPGGVITAYIDARCTTLHQSNNLFKRDLFFKACLTGTTKEAQHGNSN